MTPSIDFTCLIKKALTLCLIMIFLVLIARPALAADTPRVELFSPKGEVKGVSQVTARFSEPMVTFGDPAQEAPFDIRCEEKGRGRWVDEKTWVYEFDLDLPSGIQCGFNLKKGVKTLSGKQITGQKTFSFSTGGPAIADMAPHDYKYMRIKEDQAFALYLDARADESAILSHVYFSVEGIDQRVGVRIITGEERAGILKAIYWEEKNHFSPDRVVVIQAKQLFPSDSKVRLIWGKGVKSISGVQSKADRIFSFVVQKPFQANFSCERENAGAGCIPMLPMQLTLSAPISPETADRIVMEQSDGTIYRRSKEADKNGEGQDQDLTGVTEVVFKGPFPENTVFSIRLPEDIRDDAGRKLVNKNLFPLKVKTGTLPPLAKFSSRFGIIEKNEDASLPVTLRNLKDASIKGKRFHPDMKNHGEIIHWLRQVAGTGRKTSVFSNEPRAETFSLQKPLGAKAFEVLGIPLKTPGLHVVELESRVLGASLLGQNRPMYVPTAALVTNLAAHLKRGKDSSLVFVTALDTGAPVQDAAVAITDCEGRALFHGKTDESGIVRVPENLSESPAACPLEPDEDTYFDSSQLSALRDINQGYFVFAETKDDMTFVHSSWDQGIESWRYQLPHEPYGSANRIAHTIMDRTLLRAGETVHMKHIMRKHGISGFSYLQKEALPASIVIQHQGTLEWEVFPLKWNEQGMAETEWKIPETAKLGNYLTALFAAPAKEVSKMDIGSLADGYSSDEWMYTGFFRVEAFRVPLMKAVIQAPREPMVNAEDADLSFSLGYLSGGGAGNVGVKIRTAVQSRVIEFSGYEDYVFGTDEIKEGLQVPQDEPDLQADFKKIEATDLVLDDTGSRKIRLPLSKTSKPRELLTEMEYMDPNGEIQTVSSKIPLWPSRCVIGVKPDSWTSSKDRIKFAVALLDIEGKPVSGIPVEVKVFEKKAYSHRKRLTGGFYAYEEATQIRFKESFSPGKTGADGLLICEKKPLVSGNLIIQASARDAKGNQTLSSCEIWVPGDQYEWFDQSDNDRIDLLPEKKQAEPGETARFQVRLPFAEATVLVTVEREGILDAFVRHVSGKDPVIEVPVKGNYAPNVFVSALCVRGRVKGTAPTALIDLGKPGFKLGIAELKVGWKAHALKVSVSPEKPVYGVRQTAKARIRVKTADGSPLPAGAEAAIAVVDEGLLELMPNKTWDVLSAMMKPRGYQVSTATAQMQVVGKRHYGLKALSHGGGGGRQVTRELFDTLVLWKSRVILDEKGEADIEIPLNDSVTGFRIAAIASAGPGLFGSGEGSLQTTQDLALFSALPPIVRQGDAFLAAVTVKNGSDREMTVDVSALLDEGAPSSQKRALNGTTLVLKAGESRETGWEVKVPPDALQLNYEFKATQKGGSAEDRLRIRQKVSEAVIPRVFQAFLAQAKPDLSVDVERPRDAISGKGGIEVSLKPGLASGLDGVAAYMKAYPYTCMEQRISRAIALRDADLFKSVMADLPASMDKDGLVKYFPSCPRGSDVLTAYLYSLVHEAGWALPDHVRAQMEKGLISFVEGRLGRYEDPLPRAADVTIRKIAALEALSRSGQFKTGWMALVSAQPDQWPTSALLDWVQILLRMKPRITDSDKKIKEAAQAIRSRLNLQGTLMGFSTESRDHLWWLMASPDLNAVKAVLTLMEIDAFRADMPRLMNGALQRQVRGRWDTTPANAWGVLAVEKFARTFESGALSGVTKLKLSGNEAEVDWQAKNKGDVVRMDFPVQREKLLMTHQGTGAPWALIQSKAAIPLKASVSSGFRIRKTITPVDQKQPGLWHKGDVIRVRLDMDSDSDMTWVVVNDSVPAGSSLLGSGLARDSALLAGPGNPAASQAAPVFTERSFEAFKAYFDYIPKGPWFIEYTLRLNHAGSFGLPETRVEALYAPEMFGETPNAGITVK